MFVLLACFLLFISASSLVPVSSHMGRFSQNGIIIASQTENGMTEMIDDSSFPNQNAKVHLQVRYCGG
jgi:hypothetical protein